MSNQNMTAAGFGALASRLTKFGAVRLMSNQLCFLEGGYHTKALADSVVATLISLAENANEDDIHSLTEDQSAQELSERLSSVVKHFSSYWKNLK